MSTIRQRKLLARVNRQDSLNKRNTAEKTVITFPQPKLFDDKNKTINVLSKSPVVAETIKRGRGRPPKVVSDKKIKSTTTSNLALGSKRKLTITKKEKK